MHKALIYYSATFAMLYLLCMYELKLNENLYCLVWVQITLKSDLLKPILVNDTNDDDMQFTLTSKVLLIL